MKFVQFLLEPTVGSFARAVLRVGILLGVLFGVNVSEQQLAGIMVAVEAALQAFAQIPWQRFVTTKPVDSPEVQPVIDEQGNVTVD